MRVLLDSRSAIPQDRARDDRERRGGSPISPFGVMVIAAAVGGLRGSARLSAYISCTHALVIGGSRCFRLFFLSLFRFLHLKL